MKSKDKVRKQGITIKKIMIFLVIAILSVYVLTIYKHFFSNGDVLAKESDEKVLENNVTISNATKIDLDEVINTNTLKNSGEEYGDCINHSGKSVCN